jgi:hypothetical protein
MTRIDPPLPLSLWRTGNWLHELRAADLRCSRDETRAFLDSAKKLALSDEGIDTLHPKTEGWITGLRLALLVLDGAPDPEERVRAFSASERLVTDYLMEEVLARQPPEIREFLAITSVLERFSPELCDALLAPADPGSAGQGRALLDSKALRSDRLLHARGRGLRAQSARGGQAAPRSGSSARSSTWGRGCAHCCSRSPNKIPATAMWRRFSKHSRLHPDGPPDRQSSRRLPQCLPRAPAILDPPTPRPVATEPPPRT